MDDDDLILDPHGDGGDDGGDAGSGQTDHGADFQLPLPPLSASDKAFLRAVAARAEDSSAARRRRRDDAPLRRLMAAYDAEAAAREMPYGLAPVYQGYLLRMADGTSVDELVGRGGEGAAKGKRRMEKL